MKQLLYIIRHGETDLNKQGIVQGRGVDMPLNDFGRQQAEAFYEAYKGIHFDKIYTSTLIRTHQTVARFIDSGIPWEQLNGLDEISWGIYEGKKQATDVTTGFNAITQQWSEGKLDVAVEGGESPNQVQMRQKQAFDYITSQSEEHTVLICMHGRAMRILLCLLTNTPLSQMDDFPHMNTALYLVSYENGHFNIEDYYNINHLAQLRQATE